MRHKWKDIKMKSMQKHFVTDQEENLYHNECFKICVLNNWGKPYKITEEGDMLRCSACGEIWSKDFFNVYKMFYSIPERYVGDYGVAANYYGNVQFSGLAIAISGTPGAIIPYNPPPEDDDK